MLSTPINFHCPHITKSNQGTHVPNLRFHEKSQRIHVPRGDTIFVQLQATRAPIIEHNMVNSLMTLTIAEVCIKSIVIVSKVQQIAVKVLISIKLMMILDINYSRLRKRRWWVLTFISEVGGCWISFLKLYMVWKKQIFLRTWRMLDNHVFAFPRLCLDNHVRWIPFSLHCTCLCSKLLWKSCVPVVFYFIVSPSRYPSSYERPSIYKL